MQHPREIYHLVQERLWQAAVDADKPYYPPTYEQDGFIHATAEPELLLKVANSFYTGVEGRFLLLVIDTQRLDAEVKYEPPAPVGTMDAPALKQDNALFPHIYGAITPTSVVRQLPVVRDDTTGAFVSIEGL